MKKVPKQDKSILDKKRQKKNRQKKKLTNMQVNINTHRFQD